MNEILKQLNNRKSIRNFTGESVRDEDLKLIFEAGLRAPTSINGQQISLVYTRDKEKIKKLAELCGGQPQVESADVFISIVVDFNRTKFAAEEIGKNKHVIEKGIEGVIVGAIDAGIMLTSLQAAAESLGYGTTAIGAIRLYPNKMIELLGLPKNTYPILGTTIGVSTKEAKNTPLKPRVPLESFAMEDKYDNNAVEKGAIEYESALNKYRKDNNMDYLTSWAEQISNYYSKIYFQEVGSSLKKQGFDFKDSL